MLRPSVFFLGKIAAGDQQKQYGTVNLYGRTIRWTVHVQLPLADSHVIKFAETSPGVARRCLFGEYFPYTL